MTAQINSIVNNRKWSLPGGRDDRERGSWITLRSINSLLVESGLPSLLKQALRQSLQMPLFGAMNGLTTVLACSAMIKEIFDTSSLWSCMSHVCKFFFNPSFSRFLGISSNRPLRHNPSEAQLQPSSPSGSVVSLTERRGVSPVKLFGSLRSQYWTVA